MKGKKSSSSKSFETAQENAGTGQRKTRISQEEMARSNFFMDDDEEDVERKPKRKNSSDNYESKKHGVNKAETSTSAQDEEALTDTNDDECYFCEEGGEILCCDNCFRSFHLECVKLDEQPEGDWVCPYCDDLQENKAGECPECSKNLENKPQTEKVTCSKCLRNMHLKCANTPLSLVIDNPLNKNFLFQAQTIKELKKALVQQVKDPEDLVKELLQKHKVGTLFHICTPCLHQAGIQKIKMCLRKSDRGNNKDYYLSKLRRASDIHSFWLSEAQILDLNPQILKQFKKSADEETEMQEETNGTTSEDDSQNESESYQIEKILGCRKPLRASKKSYSEVYREIMSIDSIDSSPFDNYKFFIKWEGLEYSHSTWEDQYIALNARDKLVKYFEIRKKNKSSSSSSKKDKALDPSVKSINLTEKPNYIEGSLFPHQLKGLNWLINEYLRKSNAILSDETGLGKETQALCFLRYLSKEMSVNGPFLIITPPNAINYWQRETLQWCPNLDVIIYGGDNASRRKINDYEFFISRKKASAQDLKPKFQIAITSFSSLNNEINKLKKVKWEVVIIDDAQKLKTNESKLYRLCTELKPNYKVVLNGAPGDSSVEEMINLAKYVVPNKTRLIDEIEEIASILVPKPINSASRKINTSEEDKGNALKKLSTILEKYTLKRTALDIGFEFTELEEKVIKINLTNSQKQLYKNTITKNSNLVAIIEGKQALRSVKKGADNVKYSLSSTLANLELICNHPNLFYLKNVYFGSEKNRFDEDILSISNKLLCLRELIPQLLSAGYKPLIFTQFPLMLDFIEHILIYKDLSYERIDRATRSADKKVNVENFKKGLSKILIISADVGDLGMELSSNEIFILMDNHFNIYRDIQAFCKAYPKERENKLIVYRFVSQSTVEEKIVTNALKRVSKGEPITNPVDQSKHDKGVIETILKFGVREILNGPVPSNKPLDISSIQIKEIIESKPSELGTPQHIKVYDYNEFFLNRFNYVDIPIVDNENIIEIEEAKTKDTEKNEEKVLEEKILEEKVLEETTQPIPSQIMDSQQQSFENENSLGFETKTQPISEQQDSKEEVKTPENIVVPQKIPVVPKGLDYFDDLKLVFEAICDKDANELPKICILDEFVRLKFLEFILKYEVTPLPLDELHQRFCVFMEPFLKVAKPPSFDRFKEYLKHFYASLFYGSNSAPHNEFFFFKVKPQVIRKRALGLSRVRNLINQYKNKTSEFRIDSKKYEGLLQGDVMQGIENERTRWINVDDYNLFRGISRYGLEEWDRMIKDHEVWSYLDLDKSYNNEFWKAIFRKIEGKEVFEGQETECYNFTKEYLRIRSHLLLDVLVDEDEGEAVSATT